MLIRSISLITPNIHFMEIKCILRYSGDGPTKIWWYFLFSMKRKLITWDTVFPRECVFDAINWLLTHWQFVCAFFVTHTKTAVRTNSIFFMCRDLRTSIYLDDNASINSVPVENRPAHKYLCWVFPWRIWFISKRTTAHVKSHLRFTQMGFLSK